MSSLGASRVRLRLDGESVDVPSGASVASAVLAAGKPFRRSLDGEPRSALCGMGICFECRLSIGGDEGWRSCQLPVADGMEVTTASARGPESSPPPRGAAATELAELSVEVAVVGGGPAGVAAAVAAGEQGRRVALIDDNPAAGGQIWRQAAAGDRPTRTPVAARRWLERLWRLEERGLVVTSLGTSVVDAELAGRASKATARRPPRLFLAAPSGPVVLRADKLVLATGAQELFLPFPGWTLPGVVGAGGLQALIKSGLDVAGRRVVVAGSGPLLLAVAELAKRRGAEVLLIAEQGSPFAVGRFAAGLLRRPAKWVQAVALGTRLADIPYRRGLWPCRAEGEGRLRQVVMSDGRAVACDLLACGFGLLPQTGLARHLGCRSHASGVIVDHRQQTSGPDIFAAGECTGVGGAGLALLEGEIAGRAASGTSIPGHLVRRRGGERRFAAALARTFALRPELRELADGETIVCRCEDVPWRRLTAYGPDDARRAKLETRCGMGPCQGRVCGGALSFLLGFGADRIRPPFYPITLDTLTLLGADSCPVEDSP